MIVISPQWFDKDCDDISLSDSFRPIEYDFDDYDMMMVILNEDKWVGTCFVPTPPQVNANGSERTSPRPQYEWPFVFRLGLEQNTWYQKKKRRPQPTIE